MASEHGIVRCIDPKDGSLVWVTRAGGKFWASPIGADGKIYILDESGDTVVLKAGRSFKQIARNSIGERTVASPAISRGKYSSERMNISSALASQFPVCDPCRVAFDNAKIPKMPNTRLYESF
jgi:outer membrane protein assembly factor BamB